VPLVPVESDVCEPDYVLDDVPTFDDDDVHWIVAPSLNKNCDEVCGELAGGATCLQEELNELGEASNSDTIEVFREAGYVCELGLDRDCPSGGSCSHTPSVEFVMDPDSDDFHKCTLRAPLPYAACDTEVTSWNNRMLCPCSRRVVGCKLATCPAGSGLSSDGSECEVCEAGSFSPNGADPCMPCEGGTFALNPGSAACDSCPAGMGSSPSGATSCGYCDVGSYSTEGSPCTPCLPGTYADKAGTQECDACDAGKSSGETGATSSSVCADCTPGKFSGDGWPKCALCYPGTFTGSSGSTSCDGA
jgi:hypothetical protein